MEHGTPRIDFDRLTQSSDGDAIDSLPPGETRPWLQATFWSLIAWGLMRVVLSAWGFAVWYFRWLPSVDSAGYTFGVPAITEGWAAPLWGIWSRWDAIHFIRIASSGYESDMLSAFFPLYPTLARILHGLTGLAPSLGLLLISNLSLIFALMLLYLETQSIAGAPSARRAVFIAVIFPGAFFFFAPYPHSLALLLTLFAFRQARNGRWIWSALAGILAGLTSGWVFFFSILIAWVSIRRQPREWLGAAVASLAPAAGTACFLLLRTWQDFPPLSTVLLENWGRTIQPPWQTLMEMPRIVFSPFIVISGWINLLVLALLLFTTIIMIHRLPIPFVVFQAAMLLLFFFCSTPYEPLSGLLRFALMLFPQFIALAIWADTRPRQMAGLLIAGILQLYTSALYIGWIWVA